MQSLTLHHYQSTDDYWQIRSFLRDVMQKNQHHEFSWHVARLDYWWWFANADLEKIDPATAIFIWRDAHGKIAAVVNPEGRGQAYLQIDPDFFSDALYAEMLQTAEAYLAIANSNGTKTLQVFCDSKESRAHLLLQQAGYALVENAGEYETQHRRNLSIDLPAIPATPGYTIHALGGGLEMLERAYASGLGFHNDDINVARENRDNPAWYHHIQTAPLYRRELDLVAVTDEGAIASFCTIWFDDVSRTAYFEPVATVPAHQKRGLGKAVMLTGLHRLKQMGCITAFVGGYSTAANALYFSVMGPDHDVSQPWQKVL